MSEAALVRRCMAELKKQGHWCARHHASGYEKAGLHDVEASVFSRFVALEFKDSFQKWKEWMDWTPDKAPNQTIATQKEVQAEVRACGGIHIVVWRWAEIQIVIDEIAAGTSSKEINALVTRKQEEYRKEHAGRRTTRQAGRSHRTRRQRVDGTLPGTSG